MTNFTDNVIYIIYLQASSAPVRVVICNFLKFLNIIDLKLSQHPKFQAILLNMTNFTDKVIYMIYLQASSAPVRVVRCNFFITKYYRPKSKPTPKILGNSIEQGQFY